MFISESKLGRIFPFTQFCVAGFKQLRQVRNGFESGFMLYINDNIRCRPLTLQCLVVTKKVTPDLELIVFDLHQSKQK